MAKHLLEMLALLALCAPTAVAAASLSQYTSKEGNVVAILQGEIVEGDAQRLTDIIQKANDATKFVSGVRLNSLGGNLSEGVKLAKVISNGKMATVVPSGATCASACFVAFAAGAEKYVSNSAAVGVHGASEGGSETPASSAATIAMARIVKDLGVPSSVLGKMVVTPPSQVVWLTPNDLRAMGATMTGKPSQLATTPVLPQQIPAQSAPAIEANVSPTWKSITDKAFSISAGQHNGKPLFNRVCQPEMRVCSNAVIFKGSNDVDMMLRTEEDMSGTMLKREICSFNSFGDIRKCINWDTNAVHTDMKDSKGEWTAIANQ